MSAQPWKRHLSTRQVGPSSRSGSSSPRVGVVYVERVEYEPCECGGARVVGSVHSPVWTREGVRDCMGRLVLNWSEYAAGRESPRYAARGT